MTETRTGPLGCSNYDNLDSISSVLVHSPENKIQLQGTSETRSTDKMSTGVSLWKNINESGVAFMVYSFIPNKLEGLLYNNLLQLPLYGVHP